MHFEQILRGAFGASPIQNDVSAISRGPTILSSLSPNLLGTGIAMNPPGESNKPGRVKQKCGQFVSAIGRIITGEASHESGRIRRFGPCDWLKVIPFQAVTSSDRLGWVGLEAARYHASPAWEYNAPALRTTGSSWSGGRRKNWNCGLTG